MRAGYDRRLPFVHIPMTSPMSPVDAPADARPGEAAALADETECVHWQGLFRCSNERECTIELQQLQVRVDVVPGRHAVQQEVEAAPLRLHGNGIRTHHHVMRTEAQAIVHLAR